MEQPCRLLPNKTAPGDEQMATDEALLDRAIQQGFASLRFYTWSEPTLSLGYFQPHAERLPNVAWLRRPTGGAAILHHHEITYALALPAERRWHTNESWLCRMHHVIQRALRAFDVATRPVVCGEEKKLGPVLCFLHQTPSDLTLEGHKVVGSAQRRPHGALLQHGSILLRMSEHTPQLPGLCDLSGKTIAAEELQTAIEHEFRHEVEQPLEASDWTEAERHFTTATMQDKYRSPEWNAKR